MLLRRKEFNTAERRGFIKSGLGLSAAAFLAGPLAVYAKGKDIGSNQRSALLGFDAIGGSAIPRSSTVVITKDDGGVIGS